MTDKKTRRKALDRVTKLEGDSLESNVPTVLFTLYVSPKISKDITELHVDRTHHESVWNLCEYIQQQHPELPWLVQYRSWETLKVVHQDYCHMFEPGTMNRLPREDTN